MHKKTELAQAWLFLAFIAFFFLINLLLPDVEFSERENRYLQQAPEFSFRDLFSGRFTSDFEAYTSDQFAFRDAWTTLKARSELAAGKKENKGVYLCRGETLIEKFGAPDLKDIDLKMAALEKMRSGADVPVYFALIPGPSEIWSHKLPENAPNDSQKAVIDYAYAQTGAAAVDIFGSLSSHADEYIYYRTDHHWTSLGAYYGYEALMSAMDLPVKPLSSYSRETVTTDFYGTVYSSSGFSWVKPDTVETFVEEPAGLKVTNYSSGEAKAATLYDRSFLEKKDKYSFFLGGNTPLIRIETENADAPSLLIIRDSYMDSLAPFLLENFSELIFLDLRYYRTSLKDFIAENKTDLILICYSVENFCSDTNIGLLGQ